jgi:hypothetical protein
MSNGNLVVELKKGFTDSAQLTLENGEIITIKVSDPKLSSKKKVAVCINAPKHVKIKRVMT